MKTANLKEGRWYRVHGTGTKEFDGQSMQLDSKNYPLPGVHTMRFGNSRVLISSRNLKETK